ncbi:hypothetical protein Rsub_09782 [Raphidocelis subcapitata]|uniref:Uncharacterized protein n=1 Tax=Raphidocelis subcapitata TaxID=307507 RepID=A0A2V0PIW1_9CHLO|nr:hypothetical protein Rsub_09782 [Raphidocelis subcapitata]|eukprot:GBF96985.1 hypothetical protein Rsub_09782 [Raphidocelis subcapitata]
MAHLNPAVALTLWLALALSAAAAPRATRAAADLATTGEYRLLGQAPIAAAHQIQLPCGSNQFLMMEFGPTGVEGQLMLPHPASNPDGTKVLWLWNRDTNEWTHIPTGINSICGGWAKLANGNIGMFAGHYQTLGYKQTFGMNRIMQYDATARQAQIKANLTAQRWYPTALMMPSGHVWVPGGTWAQKPNGTWPKAAGADMYAPYADTVRQVPLNRRLWDASIGNWYMGSLVLPNGKVAAMNMNMMQVIDPWSGEALAEAPALAGPVKDVVWEFPRMGPQVMLRADAVKPGAPMRYEFSAFGGSFMDAALRADIGKCGPVTCDREAGEQRVCSHYALRIGLTVHPDGRHEFDPSWEVEEMPGPRCIFDGVLLPNGHVVLLGGQKRGIGDLTNATHYNGGNEPWAQPWIYNPYAPAGRRFSVPGAATKIARLYHAVAQLTSRGDILATGTSNAAFWETPESASFEKTPLGVNEYRQEAYSPPYLFRPNRPRAAAPAPPAWVPYGGSFKIGYSFPDAPGNITGVVWSDPGGTTHNSAIGHRSQLLPFSLDSTAADGKAGVLTVSAPAEPNHAPPGFYLVFLLSGDLYSEGTWVQIREAAPKPLAGVIAPGAQFVAGLSSGFEAGGGAAGGAAFRVLEGAGVAANASAEAAGAGATGLRISLAAPGKDPVLARVASGAAKLEGGKWCTLMLWARASAAGQKFDVSVAREGGGETPLPPSTVRPQPGAHCLYTLPAFKPAGAGSYQIIISADLSRAAPILDIDDVEVYCA